MPGLEETFETVVLADMGHVDHILSHMKHQMTVGNSHHKDCLEHCAAVVMVLFPTQAKKDKPPKGTISKEADSMVNW